MKKAVKTTAIIVVLSLCALIMYYLMRLIGCAMIWISETCDVPL